jgi:hypothetical protein
MAVMGGFHALAAGRVPRAIGWLNFLFSGTGAICLAVAMTYLASGDRTMVPLVIVGSATTILGMATFLLSVLLAWLATERAARAAA